MLLKMSVDLNHVDNNTCFVTKFKAPIWVYSMNRSGLSIQPWGTPVFNNLSQTDHKAGYALVLLVVAATRDVYGFSPSLQLR